MKLVKYLILGMMGILSHNLIAQTRIINGVVLDAESQQPIGICNVSLLNTNKGTNTDTKGRFKLEVLKAQLGQQLIISYIGYQNDTVLIQDTTAFYKVFLKLKAEVFNAVVFTGVTKATLIRENPVAVVSISKKQLEQTNESNIIDVLVKNTPGLNAVKTGANISKPFIRGLGYNRVLTLYDGIRQEGQQWGDEHSIEIDAYNMQRAEVIKGPSSLLYGSDALAGVVSLFPFIPDEQDKKLHGKWVSEYQSNNNLIGNGWRLSYSSKHFLAALRGSYRIANNYRNAVDGRVYNTNFRETNWSGLVGYTNHKGYSHLNFTLYDNLQGIPDGSRDSLSRQFTKQVFEGANDDIKNRQIVTSNELNTYRLSPLHQHIQHYRLYTHHAYKIGTGDIDLILGVQQNKRREYSHPTMPSQAGLYVRLNTLNYGLRYNLPKWKSIETTVGFNGMLQNNISIDATDFPIPDYQLFDGGMYGYGKWKSNKWSVSGGIRYDVRQVKWRDFYLRTHLVTGFNERVDAKDTIGATLQFPAYEKLFNGVSASLGITYQLNKHIGLKANIGRGYRAPNITEVASNGLDPGAHIIYLGNKNFKTEFSLQEDIGASARFKNVTADISLFNNYIQNYIYLSLLVDANGSPILDPQGNKTYQYQQAAAQLYGMEASLSWHPKKYTGFSFDNSVAMVYGFNRKAIYKNEGVNGGYLPLIPPMKLQSAVQKKFILKSKVVNALTTKAELELNARQDKYLGLSNTETATPGFALFNIGVSTEIKYSKWQTLQLQFQINNLFDRAYQSNLSRLKYFEYYNASPNGRLGMFSMGRNIYMKLVCPF